MRHRRRRLSLRDRLRRRRRIVELALSKSVPTERLKAAHTSRPPSRLVIAAGLKLVAVPIDSTRTRRSLASGSRARLPTPAEPERVAPVSASRSGPVPPGEVHQNGAGNSPFSIGWNDRDMVVYFDSFGTRFFGLGPDRPWHGQASLNASRA